MTTYILRRLLLMIPTLLGMTFLLFMLVAASPQGIGASLQVSGGGQVEATSRALLEAYLEDRYGLNDPPALQYVRWLGRISPIKFGERDQRSPAGERIAPPKRLDPPPAWSWFTDKPPEPTPDKFEFPPEAQGDTDAAQAERTRLHRVATNQYARSRATYVAARTRYEQAVAAVLREHDDERVVTGKGRLRSSIRSIDPAPFRAELDAAASDLAKQALDAYAVAIQDREHLLAVFRAKPFPEIGVAIPGIPVSIGPPDLGRSFSRSRPVGELILEALPRTLLLNLIAFPIIYLIAIPSGMLAAVRQGKFFDVVSGGLFVALWSIPIVWAGVLAIGYLANKEYLGWFPVTGLHATESESMPFLPTFGANGSRGYLLDTLWHVVLPVACLVYGGFAVLAKQTRAAMLDNFNADYVRTAKAKGVAPRDVTLRHVFRNSLLPLITMFVSIFPAMLAGSVVIEKIFSIQGMGSLVIEAISLGDRELLLANAFVIGLVNMLALLFADILYALADPRITYD